MHCQKGIVISNTALYAPQSGMLHIKEVPAEKARILKRESYLNHTFLHRLSADSQDRLLLPSFSDDSACNCLCNCYLAAADDLMEGTGNSIRMKICHRFACNIFMRSLYPELIFFNALLSATMIGKDTTRMTNAILEVSPSPNHKMNSGAMEIFGEICMMRSNGISRCSKSLFFRE